MSVALYMFIRFAFLIFLESSIVRRLMCSLSGVFTRATTTRYARDRSIKMHKRGRRTNYRPRGNNGGNSRGVAFALTSESEACVTDTDS